MGIHAGHYTSRLFIKSLGEHAADKKGSQRRDVAGMLKLSACVCRYGLDICLFWQSMKAGVISMLYLTEDILQGNGIDKLQLARDP